jgi:hypothetical protein
MTKKEKSMAKAIKTAVQIEPLVPAKKCLFDRVAGFLDANDWHYNAESSKGYFSMGCRIKEATVRVIIDVFESEEWRRIMTFSVYPIFVPENRRPTVLEALNHINHSLVYGNFEMDMADGEIRFRTTVESESDIRESMMERVLNGNLSLSDRHFAALMAVAFGSVAPESVKELATRPEDATLQ